MDQILKKASSTPQSSSHKLCLLCPELLVGLFVCSAVFISLLNGTVKSQKQGPSNVPGNAVFSGKVPSQLILVLPLAHMQASF